MIGSEVQSYTINQKASSTAVALRDVFFRIETIAEWLELHPKVNGVDDPLLTYGFTEDEVSLLRQYFTGMNDLRLANQALFDLGRRLTGLE